MKKIYIILTYTGTMLSKLIKVYTKEKYAHVSISLDDELIGLYSFGRINPYNPFVGGFVHEGINQGTFKRFKKTKAAIYMIDVTDSEYEIIKRTIDNISKNKDKYHFNVLGLFLAGFNTSRKKKDYFYCAEFVKFLLDESGYSYKLPEIVRPNHFEEIKNSKLIYEGLLNKYNEIEII